MGQGISNGYNYNVEFLDIKDRYTEIHMKVSKGKYEDKIRLKKAINFFMLLKTASLEITLTTKLSKTPIKLELPISDSLKSDMLKEPIVEKYIKSVLERMFNYIKRYYNITKKHKRYIKNLSKDNLSTLFFYNSGYFRNIGLIVQTDESAYVVVKAVPDTRINSIFMNDPTKEDKENLKRLNLKLSRNTNKDFFNRINTILFNAPKIGFDFKVWRGMDVDLKDIRKKKYWGNPLPMGTTLIPHVALRFFTLCCLFEITVPKESNYLFLNEMFDDYIHWREYEVILAPCFFELEDIVYIKGKKFQEYFPKELVSLLVPLTKYEGFEENGVTVIKVKVIPSKSMFLEVESKNDPLYISKYHKIEIFKN